MGAVYRVRDKDLNRDVALKVIRSDLANDTSVLESFKREIQLSTTVTYRNVLRVYDLGEFEGIKFLTMQYVDGQNLEDLLQSEKKPSLDRLLGIFTQICEGLAAAHEHGILHRDLKPANVLLDSEDKVYLTDFGLATSGKQTGLTQAGEIMGTPDYMSPEQVKGEGVDAQSDIFSLGVILYEIAAGKLPFSGNSVFEVMIQRTQKSPKPATEVNPSIPAFVNRIIERAMARDKVARYANISELLADLKHGTETGQTLISTQFYVRRWKSLASAFTLKRLAIIVPVILLALLGGFWLVEQTQTPEDMLTQMVAREPVSVLIADFVNETGEPEFDGALEPVLETSLEGASFITAYNRGQARGVATNLQKGAVGLTEELSRLVAQREGIAVIVAGKIQRSDSGYEVGVRALDAVSGEEIEAASDTVDSREAVQASIVGLSATIRQTLGDETPRAAQLAAIETFTASSLEAAQAYAKGQVHQAEGAFEDAIREYEKALQEDPGLGRANAGLAAMYRNQGRMPEAEEQFQLALSNLDRMSERERFKTRSGYFLVVGNWPKATEELTALLDKYPADFHGLNSLALTRFYTRNMEDAASAAERAKQIYPRSVLLRANLALYALYAGDFQGAADQAEEVLQDSPDYKYALICLALAQLGLGQIDGSTETYRRFEALEPWTASIASMGIADIALYEGRLEDAVQILREGVKQDAENGNEPAIARKTLSMASALMDLGQNDQALAEASRILEQHKEPHTLLEAARLYLRAGDEDKALELAGELSRNLASDPQAYAKLVEGEVALKRGEPFEAVKLFMEAKSSADTWLGRFLLGQAYLEAQAFTEAYAEFEQALKRKGEAAAIFLDDVPSLHYLPPVYYYMGLAQEGLGSTAAGDSFRTYVSIKKNATSDPLVTDARRRAAAAN
jgi:serine/threonine protein kinase/tetratricopeptide (TPR) repeat protein